jgi:hypothetical protein
MLNLEKIKELEEILDEYGIVNNKIEETYVDTIQSLQTKKETSATVPDDFPQTFVEEACTTITVCEGCDIII